MADVEGGTKHEGFMMTIACPPQKKVPKKKKAEVEEEIETLLLSHFTKSPRVDFNTLKLGCSCIRTLRVFNPEEFCQHVDIEKFPHKKGFSISEESFEVDGNSELLLKIQWAPEESGNCREMILFKVDGVYRLQAYVFGKVEEPPKNKTKKRKTWLSTSKAPTVQPRMAIQACLQGKENCPPRRKVSPAPGIVEKSAFSPQTTPTKDTKRRRVWGDSEKQTTLACKSESPSPSKTEKAKLTSSRTLHFTPSGAAQGSPHTPKYFPPLIASEGQEDHEFPMVTATPEIIEARQPRRPQSAKINRDTITIDKDDSRSPDEIRRETVVISQAMPRGPISRETMVISKSNLSPRQDPCVSPRVAKLRLEYNPPRQQKQKSSSNFGGHVVTTTETTELIEMSHMQRVEEEEIIVETITTIETEVDGEINSQQSSTVDRHVTTNWTQDSNAVNTATYRVSSTKSGAKSPRQEIESHLYVEEVKESVVVMEEEDASDNSVNISPPRTITKTDVKPLLKKAMVDTPDRLNIILDKPQRGSFSSTPIVSTQVLGRESFDKMTDTRPVSPVALEMLNVQQEPNARRVSNLTVTKPPASQQTKEENMELKRNLFGPVKSEEDGIAPLTDMSAGWQENGTNAKNPFEEKSIAEAEPRRFSNVTITKTNALISKMPGHFELEGHLEGQLEDSIFLPSQQEVCKPVGQMGATFRKSPSKFPTAGVSALLAKAKRSPVKLPQQPEVEFVCESPEQKKRPSDTFYVFTAPTDSSMVSTPARGMPTIDSSSIQRSLKRTAKSKKHRRSITHTIDENEANQSLLERPNVDGEDRSEESDGSPVVSPEGQDLHMSELVVSEPIMRQESIPEEQDLVFMPSETESCVTESCVVESCLTESCFTKSPESEAPVSSLFLESAGVGLSLADLTASNTEKKEKKKTSPRRSWGRITKTMSPKKTRSPVKAVRRSQAGRHYDKPWATASQRKMSKTTTIKKEPESRADKNTSRLSRTTRVDRSTVQATINSSSLSSSRSVRNPNLSSRRSVGLQQTKLQLVRPRAKSLAALPKHPLAHAAKNMYYDERWMEKEERGFICWLNFILTPPDEHFEAVKPKKIDAGSISLDRPSAVKLAPSKETLSLRAYTIRKNLNTLRARACRLLQSEEFARVHHKLEIEIECGRLAIRSDRKVHADLGLKQGILDMLLCYNPLWLRIGLEAVYGEVVPVSSNTDVYGLSRFILTRLLQNPDIAQQYSHPTVPHLYRPGYDKATSQFMLKKFLLLVMLLDHGKRQRLIKWDPCLFCKDAEFKSSRDLLINFAKDYLSGEGDITKHLSYMGYNVSYSQRVIEEYDYAVANLATDLRDGIKLTRIAELLTKDEKLLLEMRVPAISRLQKVHNTEVAFRGLLSHGVQMTSYRGEISPRDIVDGQREKTLQLLWKIIFNFQVNLVLSEEMLKDEIRFLRQNWQLKTKLADYLLDAAALGLPREARESVGPDLYFQDPKLQLLLTWCKSVCAYYKVKVENFTVSFSDGRVLCLLLHHYHPKLLAYDEIIKETSQTQDTSVDLPEEEDFDFVTDMVDPAVMEALVANERANFKLLFNRVSELGGVPMMLKTSDICNTIPDEKVVITYVSYLCGRLLDIRHETRAARIIQAAYRKHLLKKHAALYEVKIRAAIKIQKAVRIWIARRLAVRRQVSALKIQCWWRQNRSKRFVRGLIEEKRRKVEEERQLKAARKIQKVVRYHLQRRRYAALTIQRYWRNLLSRRAAKEQLLQLKQQKERQIELKNREAAAVKIQDQWRNFVARRQAKQQLMHLKQEKVKQMERERREVAALTIQHWWHNFIARREAKECLIHLKKEKMKQIEHEKRQGAAVKIQQHWSNFVARREAKQQLMHLKQERTRQIEQERRETAAVKIQQHWCNFLARREAKEQLIHLKQEKAKRIEQARREAAAIKIQRKVVSWLTRRWIMKRRNAAISLQCWWRRCCAEQELVRLMKEKEVRQMHEAATKIQVWWNAKRAMDHQRYKFLRLKATALTIQAHYRATRARSHFKQVQQSTITIQKWYRCMKQAKTDRAHYLKVKNSVVILQTAFRTWQQRKLQKKYEQQQHAAMVIQRNYKVFRMVGHVKALAEEYRKKTAATVIQTWFRSQAQLKRFTEMKRAALVIQQAFRAHQEEVWNQLRRTAAALIIQTHWRRYSCQKSYEQKRKAAIVIQTNFRRHSCTMKFKAVKMVVLLIERWYQAILLGRKARQSYIAQKSAAIKMQAAWRAHVVQRSFAEKRNAVCKLQQWFRASVIGRQCQEEYTRQRNAVIKIQQLWRARQTGKICREQYEMQKNAVVSLQRIWRAKQLGKQCREEFLSSKKAAVSLQKHWRARCLGKEYREEFLNQKSAAMSLQKQWRARQVGQKCRENFLRKKSAVVCLQKHWQAKLVGQEFRKVFLSQKSAAVCLQKHWRAKQAGRKCREDFLNQKDAAVCLQRYWRARRAGKQCREVFLNQKSAAQCLQRHWRARQAGKECRESFLKQKSAVICLQKHWQAKLVGQEFRKGFLRKKSAALCLQRQWRARQVGRQSREDYLKQKSAALMIQKHWRAKQVGKDCREDFLRRRAAALCLQKHWRAKLAGQQSRKDFLRQRSAATTLQRYWRARQVGKQCREDFLKKRAAAWCLQKHWQARQAGRLCREDFMKQKSAAECLQKHWQARKIGQQCRAEFLKEKSAAVCLQKHWRVRQVGQQCRKEYLSQKSAASSLQKHWRARKVGQQCSEEFQRKKAAAVCLQRQWRAKQAGMQCRREFLRQKSAASSLQKHWRARQTGQECRKEYLRQKSAAQCLQKHLRARRVSTECRENYLRQKSAAVCLQKHWRARKAGQQCREDFIRQRSAAECLQKYWRSRQVGQQCRKAYLRRRSAAQVLQKHWRARQVAMECREDYLRQRSAALSLQKHWRSRRLSQQTYEKYLEKKAAAISLQRHWRSRQLANQQRQDYLNIKQAAVVLQQKWRATLLQRQCQRDFTRIRSAVIVLQTHYRALAMGRQCRAVYAKMQEDAAIQNMQECAALTLQRQWRAVLEGRMARENYARLKQASAEERRRIWAAIVLQRSWRAAMLGRRCRIEYAKMKEAVLSQKRTQAAEVLQRRWRAVLMGRQCREVYVRMMEAAVVYRRQTSAALVLQRRWRAYVTGRHCRDVFTKLMKAKVVSQRRVRAVTVLQRCWRALLIARKVRRDVFRMRQDIIESHRRGQAAIVLQRHWRAILLGRQCREMYASMRESQMVLRRCTWASTVLQRRWRAILIGRQCRREYSILKENAAMAQQRLHASVTLQRHWRAYLVGRQCRVEYTEMRRQIRIASATVTIQRRWRALIIGRQCRREYAKMRETVRRQTWAALVLQRRWRALLGGRQCREEFFRLKQTLQISRRRTMAAIVIQKRWRALLVARECIVKERRRRAVVILQRRWRALITGRQCRKEYQKLRQDAIVLRRVTKATVIVQRRWRAVLKGRRCRQEYARMLHVWRISQRFLREDADHKEKVAYMQRCVKAATVMQRHWRAVRIGRQCRKEYILLRDRKREERLALEAERRAKMRVVSAVKIQCLWRGFVLRKNIKDVKMNEARKRIHKVSSAVRDEDRLGNRTSFAIENLLKYKHVSQVLRAVTDLDASTRHSPVCCERLVSSNALPILFTLINVCNRSLPHMEIISYTVNVLLNLSKYHKTVASVFEVEGCLDTLLELLKIYREKGVIFTRTCTLIGLLCQDETRAQITRDKPGFVDKLLSIHKLCRRKHEMEKKRMLTKATSNKLNPFATHKLCPQWFARRYSTNEIDDPLEALRYLLNSIGKLPEDPAARRLPTRDICPRYPRSLVVPPKKH